VEAFALAAWIRAPAMLLENRARLESVAVVCAPGKYFALLKNTEKVGILPTSRIARKLGLPHWRHNRGSLSVL
jgi:hypothetical protein